MELNDFIAELRQTGTAQSVTRQPVRLDMTAAIEAVTAIGSAFVPAFRIDDDNRFVYENLIRWIHTDPTAMCQDPDGGSVIPANLTAGLYICGPTGTGKSVALNVIMQYARFIGASAVVRSTRRNGPFRTGMSRIPIRADRITDEFAATGSFDRWKTEEVLAVQDFGSEPAESAYMGNKINVMKAIVEYRGDRADMITHFTSNLSLTGTRIGDMYGDRVSSRLRQMCNVYILKGKDRRI